MERKILVAYDGSELCDVALKEAEVQAAAVDAAEVHVLAVVCHSPLTTAYPAVALDLEQAEAEKLQVVLHQVREDFVIHNGEVIPKVIIDHAQRNAGRAIVEYAKDQAIDLIIIGSRGLGNVSGKILGSVSNQVVQGAGCHVLVIK